MVSQDTGSAILGPARADIYFGSGREAGAIAGRIRQQGRFTMLLPRELDMVEAGRSMPLPLPKPPIPEDTKKDDTKAKEAKKGDAKKDAAKKPVSDAKPSKTVGKGKKAAKQPKADAKAKTKQDP
jgi:membrane-bound lytic murein transglycosylase A